MDNLKSILICGESGHGKSASLLPLKDRKDVLYLNCENGKPLPFPNNFKNRTVTDPEDIIDWLTELEHMGTENPFNIIVIDTVSFMMDLYETVHVINSSNTQKAWGNYGQFFKRLMTATAKIDAFFIFLGHLDTFLDEDEGMMKHSVPVKGALSKKGLEAYFTTVIYVKRMRIKDIEKLANNKLLNITDKERNKGYKHVFLTDSDKTTIGGRIRSPLGMWEDEEIYIDNNIQHVLNRLTTYYSQ